MTKLEIAVAALRQVSDIESDRSPGCQTDAERIAEFALSAIAAAPEETLADEIDLSNPDNRFYDETSAGEFPYTNPDVCRGCGNMILPENRRVADGCPCNSPRGINHGLVPKNTCTCSDCDPLKTGSTRYACRRERAGR